MSKLIVELPNNIHQRLKKKAVLSHRTLKDIVIELLSNYLERSEKVKTSSTGFCGKWKDVKSAEEIILDIRANRKWFREDRVA